MQLCPCGMAPSFTIPRVGRLRHSYWLKRKNIDPPTEEEERQNSSSFFFFVLPHCLQRLTQSKEMSNCAFTLINSEHCNAYVIGCPVYCALYRRSR